MSLHKPPPWTIEDFEVAAQEYLAKLPPEHFMEATSQATQREISVESFALLRPHFAHFHYFNELLIQFFYEGNLRQAVPDNFIVLGPLSDHKRGMYALDVELVRPLWMLEYASSSNRRKDYEDSYRKYEEAQIPYYMVFDPDRQDLRFYRHNGAGYQPLRPDADGWFSLPELELQLGIVGGWVRYRFRGELLPLPAELQARVDRLEEQLRQRTQELEQSNQALQQRDETIQQKEQMIQRAEQARQEQEQALQRAEQARQEQEQALQRAEQARQEQEQALQRAEQVRHEQEQALQRAEQARHEQEQALQRAEQTRLAAEQASREAEQARQRNEQALKDRDDQIERTRVGYARLAPKIEKLARQAGRQDILDQLPTVTEPLRLNQWLEELL